MLDTLQFSVSHITTAFCYYDKASKQGLLIDVGTSDNVPAVLHALRKFEIPLEHLKGITLSHYHFDHAGGASRLYKKMAKKNPDFKIFTTAYTRDRLQDAASHVKGARTTFGEFVGIMKPIPAEQAAEAYVILDKTMEIPLEFAHGEKFRLVPTPGHCPDHVSPALFYPSEKSPRFLFAGEAAGTFYHESKLVSAATSMPPNYQHQIYMRSLQQLIDLRPRALGTCHYGAIVGEEDVHAFLVGHQDYVIQLYEAIKRHYHEKPEVRYVINQLKKDKLHVLNRVGARFTEDPTSQKFLSNLQLALTYGILVDLGYREPKYEARNVIELIQVSKE